MKRKIFMIVVNSVPIPVGSVVALKLWGWPAVAGVVLALAAVESWKQFLRGKRMKVELDDDAD